MYDDKLMSVYISGGRSEDGNGAVVDAEEGDMEERVRMGSSRTAPKAVLRWMKS